MKKYSLNIAVSPDRCDPRDFIEIVDKINQLRDDISVRLYTLVPNQEKTKVFLTFSYGDEIENDLPSFTMCLIDLPGFNPYGKLLMSRAIDKMVQYEIFKQNNILTPHTEMYDPDMNLDVFDRYAFLKPFNIDMHSEGAGLFVLPIERLKEERRRFDTPYIIQQFIDSGENIPCIYRATLFLGEVLYICRIDGYYAKKDGVIPENYHNKNRPDEYESNIFGYYPDVYGFSKQIARAFPDVPALGIDIIQDHVTKEMYALEVNAGGNIWHFSSKTEASKNGLHSHYLERRKNQYGAFDIAAKALIDHTIEYAT